MPNETPTATTDGGPALNELLELPHLGINLAVALHGVLRRAVRATHPRDFAIWPAVSQWKFKGGITPMRQALVVIHPTDNTTIVGPGKLPLLSAPPSALVLPPTCADDHAELRRETKLREDSAVFIVPLRVATDHVGAMLSALTDDDRASIDHQIEWNVETQRRWLAAEGFIDATPPARHGEGLPLDEANLRAREILEKRSDMTARELAEAIPCSLGQIPRLTAWQAVRERRIAAAPPRSVRATATDPELLDLIAEQSADMEADVRLPARRSARQRKRPSD
jgi:hypothetical protein